MSRDEQYQVILDALEAATEGLTFTEIQRATGLHPEVVHRRLVELESLRAIAHVDRNYMVVDPGRAMTLEAIGLMRSQGDFFGGPGGQSHSPFEQAAQRATRVQTYPGLGIDFRQARVEVAKYILRRARTLRRLQSQEKIAVVIVVDVQLLRREAGMHRPA